MSDEASAIGDAGDATVDTTGEAELADARAEAEAAVARAEAKVDKQRAHLAGAEQALEEARAALAAL